MIAQARRRRRWRLGMVVGGGGAATALAIVAAVALVPTAGGGPVLGAAGSCDVQLPLVAQPTPKPPYPTDKAPLPWSVPLSPGPLPSGKPTPSGIPSGAPTPYPLPGGAVALPGPAPEGYSQTLTAIIIIISDPRPAEMSCFFKHRLLELRPEAKFIPHLGGPMDVRFASRAGADGRKIPTYEASAYIVDGRLLCLFSVAVAQGDYAGRPGLRHADNQATATYKTKSSTIAVTVEGGAVKDEDIMAIAKAPELDMFR